MDIGSTSSVVLMLNGLQVSEFARDKVFPLPQMGALAQSSTRAWPSHITGLRVPQLYPFKPQDKA